MAISPTSRQLAIFHLFYTCNEVSYEELRNNMPNISDRTFRRDIKLLKDSGALANIQCIKVGKENIFIWKDKSFADIKAADNPKEQKDLIRLRRLCMFMAELYDWGVGGGRYEPHEFDPYAWYRNAFPEASEQDMLDDIEELEIIGYRAELCEAESYDDENDGNSEDDEFNVYDIEAREHFYIYAPGSYSLNVFTDGWFDG